MQVIRRAAAIALLGCLAIGGWVYAQTSGRRVLTAQDYTEITELYQRMYQGSDLRELDLWVSTFADDGVFRLPTGNEVSGKTALTEWRSKSFGGMTGDSRRRHWTSGVMLSANADGTAKSRAYWLVLDVSKKQPVVMATGTFDDVLVKTAGGWKFKRHGVYGDLAE